MSALHLINWKEKLPVLAIFILLAFGAALYISYENNLTYEQKACILGGGQWNVLPDQCADKCERCGPLTQPLTIEACDCGPAKCWDDIKLKCR